MKPDVFLSGFFGALLGAASLVIVTIYEANQRIELERRQFESQLILNSIVSNSTDETKQNIRFLLETGFISKKNEKILALLDDTTFIYSLPKFDTVTIRPQSNIVLNQDGIVMGLQIFSSRVLDKNGNPIKGAVVYTNPVVQNNFQNIQSYFSSDTTDEHGIFSVALPFGKHFTFLLLFNGKRIDFVRYPLGKRIRYPEKFIIND